MTHIRPDLETAISTIGQLNHLDVDWPRVQRSIYLVHQQLHYEYPGPITDLKQRLMIVPPDQHADQRRIDYRLDVSLPTATFICQDDVFGNKEINLSIPYVERSVDFSAWILVERCKEASPLYLPIERLSAVWLLEASALTQPDEHVYSVAAQFMAEGKQGLALAHQINSWVYKQLRYAHNVTDIHTTATQALALGQGVCQDYAHLMLVLCRLCALPARYVSGHMLGEGGTHAWVEVFFPVVDQPDKTMVIPFDPTHGRLASLSYLTIAVGRDYFDVAPTSGTFCAAYRGHLSTHKRVNIAALEYVE
ncbi:MAG TPA: transglutaminase family protein [Ktedonobacteraceae bacterium]